MSLIIRKIVSVALLTLPLSHSFNNPAGVDIWCGKAYRRTNASFSPGGWLEEPETSSTPLLNIRIRPRMTVYLESDTVGSFLVDMVMSDTVGQPYLPEHDSPGTGPALNFEIIINNATAISTNITSITIGTKNLEVFFDLSTVLPSLSLYSVTFMASSHLNASAYTANTKFVRLPSRTDGGSVTRVDNLYGGLSSMKRNETEWSLIFPYTYFVQWSLYWYANLSTLEEFSAMGYNVIQIVPTSDLSETPFPWDTFKPYLDRADELGLYIQFSVRWDPSNTTVMIDQVMRLRSHPSILLWYTGDEPDGSGQPLDSTAVAYDTIRSLDPYHPVSLTLNCYNFYYENYASGAEIVLSDVYPISTNTSWSTVYETPCNTTYGCCGCDDCEGVFEDISERLDNYIHFDYIIGWPKTHWSAPQAFGDEAFWTRYPTSAEEVVMTMLSINHAAKGIVMWDFPTSAELIAVTNNLGSVLTSDDVARFLLDTPLIQTLNVSGASKVDAAAWIGAESMLLSVVNLGYRNMNGSTHVTLPVPSVAVLETLWGDVVWEVNNGSLSTTDMPGLGVSLMVLKLD